MIKYKGALGALFLSFVLSAFVSNAHARIQFDAFGGELEMEGFLKSETRTHMFAGKTHMGQWIQKFQLEAALSYTDVGIFDELTFVTVLRPEYDVIQDLGSLSSGRIGDGSDKPSKANRAVFNATNDALGFGGFDFAFATNGNFTGGIGKEINAGLATANQFAEMFEVDFRRSVTGDNVSNAGGNASTTGSGFPLVVQKSSNLSLDCARCIDMNVDNHKVAMGMTDSNGKFYPFRELYMDGVIGDFWIRFGKQQIVWGKTDFFRMQDLINPIDYGQHFFFDSMEDIRIPQWMLSVQYKAGEIGPLTDNAFQFVWNFDQFARVGLGNPSQMWAHPFAKDMSTFGIYNTYFSKEPCVTRQMTNNRDGATIDSAVGAVFGHTNVNIIADDICGALGFTDNRTPAGFGTPSGLSVENRPDWEPSNTEMGWRWEFRVSDFRFALSHWYGWNDLPVFKFHTVNLVAAHMNSESLNAAGLLPNNALIGDFVSARGAAGAQDFTEFARNSMLAGNEDPFGAGGFNDAIFSVTPQVAVQMLADHSFSNGTRDGNGRGGRNYQALAANAMATGNFAGILNGIEPGGNSALNFTANGSCSEISARVFCSPLAGGQTSIEYKQSHTVGLSMDYFEPRSGVVMRVESAWTFDQLVNNTRSVDWVDESDVMAFSLGFDRPTFIPFLNKDRTFFLSLQIFDTWYWDHEGDKNTGFFVDEHNWITTFFFIGNYARDTVKPIGFYVWEEASNSHVAGFNVEWLINNNWSMKGGFHLIWEGDNNFTHDTGPYANFIHIGDIGNGTGTSGQFPYVQSVFGVGREGIGALRNYDEIFFEIKYQF